MSVNLNFLHIWIFYISQLYLGAFLALFCDLSVTFWHLKTKKNHVSHVTSQMSHVSIHMSHVTFHLSLTPTATDHPLLTPSKYRILWPLSTITTFVTNINTSKQTRRLYDRPGPEGRVGKKKSI